VRREREVVRRGEQREQKKRKQNENEK